MYVITNRVVFEDREGLDAFGDDPNPSGPNELRLVKVSESGKFNTEVQKDRLKPAEVKELIKKHGLDIDPAGKWFASLRVACELYQRALDEKKHLLLFVHGYNNDLSDIIRTSRQLQQLYNVIVVPFSWPANGGGKLSGTAAYLSDKDDARSSATAFHRAVDKVDFYYTSLTKSLQRTLWDRALARHRDNPGKAYAVFDELLRKECDLSLNLMCLSMGNYVLKYATKPGNSALRKLVFDNVSLVAADANNPEHAEWVQSIPTRNRLFVVINENDGALKWSRRKPGDEQKERLGAHLRNLTASNAYYISVTRNRGVGDEHSYFKGSTVSQNATLKGMFKKMFEGGDAESGLDYRADLNFYHS